MDSLALSTDWDLSLTPGGNMAVVSGAERIAQDVACYERTFQGEPWYTVEDGVPYLQGELASLPPAELVTERANRRAMQVPGVVAARTTLTALDKRELRGTIEVTTEGGEQINVAV